MGSPTLRRDKQGKVIAYNDLPWQEQQGGHSEHAKAYEAARLDAAKADVVAAINKDIEPGGRLEGYNVFIPTKPS